MSGGRRGHKGRRAAGKARVGIPRRTYLLVAAVLGCVVAWGVLVWMAISFGASARSGHDSSWAFLGLAAVGAVACLFLGLMLATRALQSLGVADSHKAPLSHRH